MSEISELTDEELILKIKEDFSSKYFDVLFERHKKIYYSVCSYYTRSKSVLNYHDVIEDAYFVFNWTIQKFNSEMGTKFSTFLYLYSRYYCLNLIKKRTYSNHIVDVKDDELDIAFSRHSHISDEFGSDGKKFINEDVFNLLGNMKDKRIQQIFRMRFFGDSEECKWKNISGKLNLTPQRTYTLFHQGKKYLAKNLER